MTHRFRDLLYGCKTPCLNGKAAYDYDGWKMRCFTVVFARLGGGREIMSAMQLRCIAITPFLKAISSKQKSVHLMFHRQV